MAALSTFTAALFAACTWAEVSFALMVTLPFASVLVVMFLPAVMPATFALIWTSPFSPTETVVPLPGLKFKISPGFTTFLNVPFSCNWKPDFAIASATVLFVATPVAAEIAATAPVASVTATSPVVTPTWYLVVPLVFLVEPSTVTKLFAFASTVDCVLVSVTPERFATNLPSSTLMVLLSTFTPKVYFFVPLLLLLSVKVKPVPFATLACVLVSFALMVTTPLLPLVTVTLLPARISATFAFTWTSPFVPTETVVPWPGLKFKLSPGFTTSLNVPFSFNWKPELRITSERFLFVTNPVALLTAFTAPVAAV